MGRKHRGGEKGGEMLRERGREGDTGGVVFCLPRWHGSLVAMRPSTLGVGLLHYCEGGWSTTSLQTNL